MLDSMSSASDPAALFNESHLAWIDGSAMLPFSPGTVVESSRQPECFQLVQNNGNLVGQDCGLTKPVSCEVDCRPGIYLSLWMKQEIFNHIM